MQKKSLVNSAVWTFSHVGAESAKTFAKTYHLCQSPPLNEMTLWEFLPSLLDQTNPLYQESGDYYYVKVGTAHADVLAAFFQSLYDFLHSYSETKRLVITIKSRIKHFKDLCLHMQTTCTKTPLEINFTYLVNKVIYCIFKTCSIMHVLFSTQCRSFHHFIFFCSNNTQVFLKPGVKI